MKTFSTKDWGDFSATLIDKPYSSGKLLSLHGVRTSHSHFQFTVPVALCSEAGRLFRRADGDAILDLACRLIDIEAGYVPYPVSKVDEAIAQEVAA